MKQIILGVVVALGMCGAAQAQQAQTPAEIRAEADTMERMADYRMIRSERPGMPAHEVARNRALADMVRAEANAMRVRANAMEGRR